jgi:hypothetical protein
LKERINSGRIKTSQNCQREAAGEGSPIPLMIIRRFLYFFYFYWNKKALNLIINGDKLSLLIK